MWRFDSLVCVTCLESDENLTWSIHTKQAEQQTERIRKAKACNDPADRFKGSRFVATA